MRWADCFRRKDSGAACPPPMRAWAAAERVWCGTCAQSCCGQARRCKSTAALHTCSSPGYFGSSDAQLRHHHGRGWAGQCWHRAPACAPPSASPAAQGPAQVRPGGGVGSLALFKEQCVLRPSLILCAAAASAAHALTSRSGRQGVVTPLRKRSELGAHSSHKCVIDLYSTCKPLVAAPAAARHLRPAVRTAPTQFMQLIQRA